MKLLSLAAATLATLIATTSSSVAQVYDTITNATTAWYTQLGCALPPPQIGTRFLAGDNFITCPVPPICICEVEVVFVALTAGTYNVTLTGYDTQCFTVPVGAATGSVTVMPGVYIVTFTLPTPFCFTGDINAAPFFATPGAGSLSVETDSDDFVPAFDNSAAISLPAPSCAVDSNGFSLDTDCDQILNACNFMEWYTFDLSWTNANMLMALYACPPAPVMSHGPSILNQQVSARKIDLATKKAPKRLQMTDIVPKL